MASDKDKPFSWRPYRASLCKDCMATCCTMPLEIRIDDLIRLGLVNLSLNSEVGKKDLQRIAKDLQRRGLVKSYRDGTGLFLMSARVNGDCLFLDGNRRCTVYENRPEVCRRFPESMGPRLGFCPYIKK